MENTREYPLPSAAENRGLAFIEPIASDRHFLAFAGICLIFILIAVIAQLHRTPGASFDQGHHSTVPLYLSTIIGEWFLLYFVWRGVRKQGNNLFALSGRWNTPVPVAGDLVFGAIVALGLLGLDALVQHLLGGDQGKSIGALLPNGPLEIALWIALSITAGVVEELVYRGYLMRQLAARLKSLPLAIVSQGAWFGAMHSYEGFHSVISIVAIGIIFGLVAMWRKQLRTNIVAHSFMDIVGGLAPNLIRF